MNYKNILKKSTLIFLVVYTANLATILFFSSSNIKNEPIFDPNIIIFGAKPSTIAMKERTLHGIQLFSKYGGTIIFSGGKTESKFAPEAEVMRELATTYGIQDKIILENKSKNSYENLKFTKELIPIAKENIFVSDCYHIARLYLTGMLLGYNNISYSCPDQSYYPRNQLTFYYLRESVALPYYLLTVMWRQ